MTLAGIIFTYGDPNGWTMEAGAGSHHVIILVPETLALQISNTSLLLSVADSLGLVTCQVTGFGVGEVDDLAILDNLGSLILCNICMQSV